MDKQDAKILLEGLRKTCPDHGYCIEENHWAYSSGRYESEYILSIVPKSPAKVSHSRFETEEELFEYIELLIGDTHV